MAKSMFEFEEKFGVESPWKEDWVEEERKARESRAASRSGLAGASRYEVSQVHSYVPSKFDTLPPPPAEGASSIDQLVDILCQAENRLIGAGKTDMFDRIHILRGIYYGTPWSVDYAVEQSEVRNMMFNTYTFSTRPMNPIQILGTGLFKQLFNSAEVIDPGAVRGVDFGHLIIGMDARQSWQSREGGIPGHGSATGLEICTWLGDIGGGAGMLAIKRIEMPSKTADGMFHGSSFGGWLNLEGDVAGYLIGRDRARLDAAPSIVLSSSDFIADAIKAYFLPDDPEWAQRAKAFLELLGAEFEDGGTRVKNLRDVGIHVASKVYDFGDLYMQNRLRQQGRLKINDLTPLVKASCYLTGATIEMTKIFLHTLMESLSNPKERLQAKLSLPASPPTLPHPKYVLANASVNAVDWIVDQITKFF